MSTFICSEAKVKTEYDREMKDMKKDSSWTLELETTLSEVKNILGGINKRLVSSEKMH